MEQKETNCQTQESESKKRKLIWTGRDAAETKMAEPDFEALPLDEQDAWVLSLMLDVPLDLAMQCVGGTANGADMSHLWERIDETFKYGKRSALRPLKEVLIRHETLKKP